MVGEIVAGKYKLIESIESHEQGGLFLAKVKGSGARAVVEINRHASSEERLQRIGALSEVRLVSHLRHPHIVTVQEVDVGHEQSMVVSDHLTGQTLEQRLAQPVDYGTALRWSIQLARALGHAHTYGVTHGQLDLRHVLVTTVQGREQVRLKGFASRVLLAVGASRSTCFEAPESEFAAQPTAAADQYAFGVLMYRLMSGGFPFDGETEAEIEVANRLSPVPQMAVKYPSHEVHPDVEAVIHRCLQKAPAQRFRGMKLVARILSAHQDGRTVEKEPVTDDESGPVMLKTPVPIVERESGLAVPSATGVDQGVATAVRDAAKRARDQRKLRGPTLRKPAMDKFNDPGDVTSGFGMQRLTTDSSSVARQYDQLHPPRLANDPRALAVWVVLFSAAFGLLYLTWFG